MSDRVEPSPTHASAVDVIGNPVNQQYEAVRGGKVIGLLSYRWTSRDHVELEHTYVSPRERGQNIGAMLVEHAVAEIRSKRARLAPTCSYVSEYIDKHPQHADLLAPPGPGRRRRTPRAAFDVGSPEAFVHARHGDQDGVRLELLEIRTARILLRAWDLDDADIAYELLSDPAVARWMRPVVRPIREREETAGLLSSWIVESNRATVPQGRWAIERQDTGDVIGDVHLITPPNTTDLLTLWWHLRPEATGEGFASEAAHAVAHHAFSIVGIDRIYALIDPQNERAVATASLIGMRPDGTTTDYYDTTFSRYRLDRADLEEDQERRSLSLTD